MSTVTGNIAGNVVVPKAPINNAANPTSASTITLGFVALQRVSKESIGESRGYRDRRMAKLVPIRVRSISADSAFIPLAKEISLSTDVSVVEATFRPVAKGEIVLPEEKGVDHSAQTLEFTFERIPVLALIKTRDSQLMLANIDLDDEMQLPPNFELVGVVAAPVGTHSLNVYDKKTDELYLLGYVFPNTIQPDWVQLALDRREGVLAERAAERLEREAERRAELEETAHAKKAKLETAATLAKPVPTFATSDKEVVYQLQEAYAARYRRRVAVTRNAPDQPYLVEDPENFGPSISEKVASGREELGPGADAQFERERDAREYAASLQT